MSSQVFPTRMALAGLKARLKSAQAGHVLLKRKAEALTKKFRTILGRIQDTKVRMGTMIQSAIFSLTELSYSGGGHNFGYAVRSAVRTAQLRVKTRNENISGVQLPVFEVLESPGPGFLEHAGLGRGGQSINKSKEIYNRTMRALIELASLQTSFIILDQVIKQTNRRVSAIEYVVIPRIENAIKYVQSELEEQDREEFFRLKKVQAKKKRDKVEPVDIMADLPSLLNDPDDVDIIFK